MNESAKAKKLPQKLSRQLRDALRILGNKKEDKKLRTEAAYYLWLWMTATEQSFLWRLTSTMMELDVIRRKAQDEKKKGIPQVSSRRPELNGRQHKKETSRILRTKILDEQSANWGSLDLITAVTDIQMREIDKGVDLHP